MSWKVALLVAFVTAIVTAVVTAPVGERVAEIRGVSAFEGGRGMLVVFVLVPAAFIGGFLLGLIGTKLVHATEWSHFWKAAGLSIAMGQVILFSILGLHVLGIPRPPLMDGHLLALEVEVMIPLARGTPRSVASDHYRLSLYAGDDDNAYATVDTASFREENGMLIVPALAQLNSTSAGRTMSFHMGEDIWLAYDMSLPPVPKAADMEWTTPMPLRDARIAGTTPTPSDVLLRYRVVKGEVKK